MVERDMQFLIDKSRAMMSVYNAPKFWGNAVVCASNLINMTHTPNSTGKTPYEMVYGLKPDVSKFIPFYAPGVYYLTKDERQHNSWKFKAEPCRFLGYDSRTKNGAILLKLSTNRILTRDDYSFDTHYLIALREGQIDTTNEEIQDFFETYDPTEDQNMETDVETDIFFTDTLLSVSDNTENDYFLTSIPDWYNATVCIINDLQQLPPNPIAVNEALAGPQAIQWWIAIQKELEQIETLEVFTTAEQEGRGMKVKIVLRNTYDNEFNIK